MYAIRKLCHIQKLMLRQNLQYPEVKKKDKYTRMRENMSYLEVKKDENIRHRYVEGKKEGNVHET